MFSRKLLVLTVLLSLLSGCAVRVFEEDTAQDDINIILYDISQVRGLDVLAPVPVSLRDQDEVEAILLEEFEREFSEEELANEALLMYFLGLLPRDYDIKAGLIDFYKDEAAAFYDFRKDEMVLITPIRSPRYASMMMIPGYRKSMREMVLSHELVHALDDQHFNLERFSARTIPNDDHLVAIQAVAEGSAILFSYLYLFEDLLSLRPDMMEELIDDLDRSMDRELARSKVPEAVIAPVFFAYSQGFRFVHAVYKERGIEGVNALYEDETLSTENILHPDGYLAGTDLPVNVELEKPGQGDGGESPGLELLEDTFGEFGVEIILRHYLPADVAEKAAEGWAGDRYALFEGPGGTVLIWDSVWDTEADTLEFHEVLLEMLMSKHEGLKKIGEKEEVQEFTNDNNDVSIILLKNERRVYLTETIRF